MALKVSAERRPRRAVDDPTTTKTESVIQRLRELVLDGRYAPGAHLQEVTLATELGVSRTPIRDALRVLANEHLLVYAPNRGYFVRRYPAKEILDAYDVRGTLEAMACRLLAERGLSRKGERDLKDIIGRAEAVIRGPAWTEREEAEWRGLNTEFHFALIELADNHHLAAAARSMRGIPRHLDRRLDPGSAFYQTIYTRARREQSHAEHVALLDAIQNRQGSRAEALMREHVHRGRATLEAHLPRLDGLYEAGEAQSVPRSA